MNLKCQSRASQVVFASVMLLFFVLPLQARNIYVDAQSGNDNNHGASPDQAFKTLQHLGTIDLNDVDSILLRSTSVHKGTLELNENRTTNRSLYVGSYGNGKAMIDAAGYPSGVLLENQQNVKVENLHIEANAGWMKRPEDKKMKMRCGVFIYATNGKTTSDILVTNTTVEDIYFEKDGFDRGDKEVNTSNGTQSYGWGIRCLVSEGLMRNITIDNCDVQRVSHTGIKVTGKKDVGRIQNMRIVNNKVTNVGGPGMQFSSVDKAYIAHNDVLNSGSPIDSRHWGRGSGMWTWSVTDFLIEYNTFIGANGPGDSAGAHIDFNCANVILQYNFSRDNGGGFIEILGNCHNCAYRYNVSVNDGYRTKGQNGAFQEGKTLWLSGYVGENAKRNGPYNSYIYNNTIYVGKHINPKMAIENTANGALLANNVFHIEGKGTVVPGDQYKPEVEGESEMRNIVIKNNLYLHSEVLPKEYTDMAPIVGDVEFKDAGSDEAEDYQPMNRSLVGQGMKIEALSGDSLGLSGGFDLKYDYAGQSIEGNIMGAFVNSSSVLGMIVCRPTNDSRQH